MRGAVRSCAVLTWRRQKSELEKRLARIRQRQGGLTMADVVGVAQSQEQVRRQQTPPKEKARQRKEETKHEEVQGGPRLERGR